MFNFNDDRTCREDVDINITNQNTNTNFNDNMNMNTNMNFNNPQESYSMPMEQSNVMAPIIEPGRERIVNRTFVHEVPHICPINTRIINNHVYRHTYQPRYTCCEENTCTNVQCGSCCCFR